MFGDSPDIDVDGPQPSPNPWHPFLSRLHCQLVLLYHGSVLGYYTIISKLSYLDGVKLTESYV